MSYEFNVQRTTEVMMAEELSHNAARFPSSAGVSLQFPVLALCVMSHAGLELGVHISFGLYL